MLEQYLNKYFNFSNFRPGQKEIVESILAGNDVVALMPTGGGKSLCYQLPAVVSRGISIVISPLIALMKDQVDSLMARKIPAAYINSSLSQEEIERIFQRVQQGQIKLLYVAPERFSSWKFRSVFSSLQPALVAVDEAHCVSSWGHDFRPEYLSISEYIATLPNRPVIAAFTATATPEVKNDIIHRLNLQNPQVFVRGFDRPNLRFFVQADVKPKDRLVEVLRLVQSIDGAGVVYALTRKDTETIAKFLQENGFQAAAYHAGMAPDRRSQIQNDFMENRFKVIVATIAFGMGVDKADIRFVIHAGMPASLEGYYQEAGRAGRDGDTAYCILLHSKKDANTHKFFIRGDRQLMAQQGKDWQEIDFLINIKYNRLDRMIDYATRPDCRRKMILEYFDDPAVSQLNSSCRGCDVCLNWKPSQSAASSAGRRKVRYDKKSLLGTTVKATMELYQQGYGVQEIAKIRSLGVSTIFTHLSQWYLSGGQLDVDKLVPIEKQQQIKSALSKNNGSYGLKVLKNILPEDITYDEIKLTLAKFQRNTGGRHDGE